MERAVITLFPNMETGEVHLNKDAGPSWLTKRLISKQGAYNLLVERTNHDIGTSKYKEVSNKKLDDMVHLSQPTMHVVKLL